MGDPAVQGFVDRFDAVFEAAESSDGFVDRSRRNFANGLHSWGDLVAPEHFAKVGDPRRLPMTLSLWDDLESVAAYAYHGAHGEAMAKRREWFEPHDYPTYVAWWVDDDAVPDFEEAATRMAHLAEHGPTAEAFDFKNPFGSDGEPRALDRNKVRAKTDANRGASPA